ncbi:hypothetical protein bcgnr5380_62590 [Bacillus cereus]
MPNRIFPPSPRKRVLAALFAACLPWAAASAVEPEIRTDDVERFYALYNATDGHPSVAQLDEYLAQGSPSLKEFAQMRRVTGASARTP